MRLPATSGGRIIARTADPAFGFWCSAELLLRGHSKLDANPSKKIGCEAVRTASAHHTFTFLELRVQRHPSHRLPS